MAELYDINPLGIFPVKREYLGRTIAFTIWPAFTLFPPLSEICLFTLVDSSGLQGHPSLHLHPVRNGGPSFATGLLGRRVSSSSQGTRRQDSADSRRSEMQRGNSAQQKEAGIIA